MVAWEKRRLAQLLDGDLRRRNIGVPEAEVDDVFACAPQLELQPLDLGERVRGERIDSAEVHSRLILPLCQCDRLEVLRLSLSAESATAFHDRAPTRLRAGCFDCQRSAVAAL